MPIKNPQAPQAGAGNLHQVWRLRLVHLELRKRSS
jgi:hypothetical protein